MGTTQTQDKDAEAKRKTLAEEDRKQVELDKKFKEVELDVSQTEFDGKVRKLVVSVLNPSAHPIGAGSLLWYYSESYWMKNFVAVTVDARETKKFTLVVEKKADATFCDLPSSYLIRLRGPDEKEIASKIIDENLYNYEITKSLERFSLGACPLNIYVVGCTGLGKSTLINTFWSLLSESTRPESIAVVGATGGHVTTTIQYFPLAPTSLRVIDTYGVGVDTFGGQTDMKWLVQGVFPEDWSMLDQKGEEMIEKGVGQAERRAHAVIFVVPCGEEGSELKTRLKHALAQVQAAGLNPIVVGGHADTLIPEIRENPKHPGFEIIRKGLSERLGIPPAHIFPSVPYHKESKRRVEIDILNYQILEKAAQAALTNALTAGSGPKDLAFYKRLLKSDSDEKTRETVVEAYRAIKRPLPKDL